MSISVALVGYGHSARHLHAPFIRAAGMRINAVVSSRRQEISGDEPHALILERFEDVLSLPGIDLVVLATPNEFHFDQAAAVLQAGRHVVVDKPFTVTSKEAGRLIEVAKRRGLVLSCYHNRRWDSDFLTLKNVVAEGTLGTVFSAHLRWDRFRVQVRDRWRERAGRGAGLLYDLGPHLIDQAVELFGAPDWLHADVFIQRPGGTVDDAFEILMGIGALRVSLGANCLVADGGWRYRINGDRASFLKGGLDVQEQHVRQGMSPLAPEFGVEPRSYWGVLVDGEGKSSPVESERGTWRSFYSAMGEAIRGTGAPPVSAESARRVIELLEAAIQSSQQKRRISLVTKYEQTIIS